MLPQPEGTLHYRTIPFNFTDHLTASNVFQPLPNAFSPQERMVLQTSGQLQRLLSAFFNAPSRVEILYNDIVPYQSSPFLSDDEDESVSNVTTTDILNDHQEGLTTNTRKDTPSSSKLDMCFERKICMYFGDRMAYEAESMVIPRTSETLDLLAVHHYGLGQIFAHQQRSPDFTLHAVGRHGDHPGCSFWRDYSLAIPGIIDCYIRETFVEGLLDDVDDIKRDSYSQRRSHGNGTIWYNAADPNNSNTNT
ncbi:hypothetical protein O0I10_002346 [Lichtheimia ornata]|uniref:Uncharacterized protein n=1 Tax=Lichtheimia ornata TaxID=688661 RepID=A0AAD7Y0X1_9FUNG|nr:uncharacterized protein O0I10_002346 [Lichtheimia ornata]KAJ8662015.1 hypothetical protein O0I10_002346 [Lichtheimia ornata]